MSYNYTVKLHEAPKKENRYWETKVEIDPEQCYGWFECYRERVLDDDYVEGGLWFTRLMNGELELTDYDGVFELPPAVLRLLEQYNVHIDQDFYPT